MSTERKVIFWVALLAASVLALVTLSSILLPFVAGMAVAYFLDPVADRLEAAGLGRTLATSVITVVFVLLLIIALLVVVPALLNQAVEFAARMPGYLQQLEAAALPKLQMLRETISPEDLEEIRALATRYMNEAISVVAQALGRLVSGGLALFNLLSLLFITPIVAFYLLRDWDRMVERVDSLLPRRQKATVRALASEVDDILAAFVRGTGTVCLSLGVYYAIALSLVGLPMGGVIGAVAGLISFVPYLGAMIGLVASVGVALAHFDSWTMWLLVAAIFFLGQAVEGNVLTPKLVGDRVKLHPVWVIFALLAGGAMFGFLGVLLALPVAAVAGVLVRFAIDEYKTSPIYGGSGSGGAPGSDGGD